MRPLLTCQQVEHQGVLLHEHSIVFHTQQPGKWLQPGVRGQEAFRAHEIEARPPPPARAPRAKAPRWEATTAYRDTFTAHAIEPRAPPPPARAACSAAKFSGTTTSAADYVPHALEPRAVRARSAGTAQNTSLQGWHSSLLLHSQDLARPVMPGLCTRAACVTLLLGMHA